MSTTITAVRLVKPGDQVIFDKTFPATIARVSPSTIARPGHPGVVPNPDASVDLTYEDAGVLRIAKGVPHAAGPGGWRFVEEANQARSRTPLDLLNEARARGERVPEVGDIITWAYMPFMPSIIEIIPLRGRILEVFSLVEVTAEVYRDLVPPEGDAPEVVYKPAQRCRHASTANDYEKRSGYSGLWDWPGGLVQPFGPVERWKVFPPAHCGRCGEPAKKIHAITVGEVGLGGKVASTAVCDACFEQIPGLLVGSAPAPATPWDQAASRLPAMRNAWATAPPAPTGDARTRSGPGSDPAPQAPGAVLRIKLAEGGQEELTALAAGTVAKLAGGHEIGVSSGPGVDGRPATIGKLRAVSVEAIGGGKFVLVAEIRSADGRAMSPALFERPIALETARPKGKNPHLTAVKIQGPA